ncbi:hypothetical protein [Streptomyces muensis]|uniref:Uncharacterized protein n=1 Tax=Streptomyces muensis TaxID=1077944 RepID=A0A9X1PZM3_STRM4|nr:hypothetical protein [Streptomyces muensis]MCF1594591.1 hypothetical protein [Streptomyces muensis]
MVVDRLQAVHDLACPALPVPHGLADAVQDLPTSPVPVGLLALAALDTDDVGLLDVLAAAALNLSLTG